MSYSVISQCFLRIEGRSRHDEALYLQASRAPARPPPWCSENYRCSRAWLAPASPRYVKPCNTDLAERGSMGRSLFAKEGGRNHEGRPGTSGLGESSQFIPTSFYLYTGGAATFSTLLAFFLVLALTYYCRPSSEYPWSLPCLAYHPRELQP